jgi:hypothetical protein
MGYYRGDYYRGDYYRGDPGIFGAIGRVIGGAVTGFISRGPVGAIIGAASGAGAATAANIREETLAAGDQGSAYTPALRAKHALALMRGGAGGGTPIRGGLAVMPRAGGMVGPPLEGMGGRRRTHLNKSTYYRRGGGTQNLTPGLVLKHTEFVPNRRMNVANPRALRRAIRRAAGFGKLVKHMKRAIARANSAVGNVHRGRKAARRR